MTIKSNITSLESLNKNENDESIIAVDLDGTLAHYEKFVDIDSIGAPIPKMVERVKGWLGENKKVVIFTARVHPSGGDGVKLAREAIKNFCIENIGVELEVTCEKHPMMIEFWDDRAIQIIPNTGDRFGESE